GLEVRLSLDGGNAQPHQWSGDSEGQLSPGRLHPLADVLYRLGGLAQGAVDARLHVLAEASSVRAYFDNGFSETCHWRDTPSGSLERCPGPEAPVGLGGVRLRGDSVRRYTTMPVLP